MFKLILLLILFTVFVANYFFAYIMTMPTFKLISHFNFYEYLLDKFENRSWSFTWLEYSTTWNEIMDYTWWYLKTDLRFLSPKSDKLLIYTPIFILHTWNNLLASWDNLFKQLQESKNLIWYTQYISWWNDYIQIWYDIVNWKKIKNTLYLWDFYTYCSMTWTKRIDAYLYDRYLQWNKSKNPPPAALVPNSYVCKLGERIGEYQEQVCIGWFWPCSKKTYYACDCKDKNGYTICSQNNDINTNPDRRTCKNTSKNCIDYYTGSIDLNKTNCSLSWALGIWKKAKYFLIR